MDIKQYQYSFDKKKQVDILRWLEKAPQRPYSSRFLVVYSDGTVALYHKDADVPHQGTDGLAYDPDKDMIKVPIKAEGVMVSK